MKHTWYNIGIHTKKCKNCGLEQFKHLVKLPVKNRVKLKVSYRTEYYWPSNPTKSLTSAGECKGL